MPIMAVVVPTLKSNQLGWELEGERRGCLMSTLATLAAVHGQHAAQPSLPLHLPQPASPSAMPCRAAGKYLARQTLALRGVVPMLAAPMSDAAGSGEAPGLVRPLAPPLAPGGLPNRPTYRQPAPVAAACS